MAVASDPRQQTDDGDHYDDQDEKGKYISEVDVEHRRIVRLWLAVAFRAG